MGAPTRVIKFAKEKSQQFFATESERFSYRIEKFLTVYQGYNQIKPKVFPKRLNTMFSADVVATDVDDKPDCFQSTFGSTASLRRHQREKGISEGQIDTSSKIKIVIPSTPGGSAQTTGGSNTLTAKRTRRCRTPKTPNRVILTSADRSSAVDEGFLCSSVMLTYREQLFHTEKDMVRRETDVWSGLSV